MNFVRPSARSTPYSGQSHTANTLERGVRSPDRLLFSFLQSILITMIESHEALAMIRNAAGPLEKVTVGLQHALGAFLAENIVSDEDVPPFDNAGMDGFAIRAEDAGAV